MKKKIRKMGITRETIGTLDSRSLKEVAGALTTIVCSECTTCESVCPTTCDDTCHTSAASCP